MTTMPTTPIFRHIVAEGLAFNAQFVPDHQSATAPSLNWITSRSGEVPNATSAPIPTFDAAAGPTGVAGEAERVLMPATGSSFQFIRNALLPAQVYKTSVFVKAQPGTGPWNIRHGFATQGYVSVAGVTDSAWVELNYTRATPDGVSANEIYAVLGSGSNLPDLLIANSQIRTDTGAALPDYHADLTAHPLGYELRKKVSFPGSMPITGGALDMTGGAAMSRIQFNPVRTVTDFMCAILVKVDATTGGADYAIAHPTPNLFSLGVNAAGDINSLPLTTAQSRSILTGQGYKFLAVVMRNGARALYYEGVEMRSDSAAWAGLPITELLIGGTTVATAMAGKLADIVWIENRGAAIAGDMGAIYKNMRETAATNGLDVTTGYQRSFLIAEGDSTIASLTSWAYLLGNAGAMTPNLPVRNYAQSGQNLTNFIARKDKLLARIDECVAAGNQPIVGIMPSYVNYRTPYATNPAGVVADLFTLTDEYRAHGAKIMLGTPTPMRIATGYATAAQEAGRQTAMSLMRAATTRWDALADFGGDPVMGDPATCNVGSAYYYDDKHPNTAGDNLLLPIAQAALAPIV